tara:strand:- start:410 stop:646 length:237 start_codon:yes stop_codon:yes gene_type:complete
VQAAREAERFSTEIRMYKEQANQAVFDLERKKEQLEELQQKMLDNANNKNTSHEGLLWKFENDKKDLEERHRDDLNSM